VPFPEFKGGLHVCVYLFQHFKCWDFDNHFYLAVFKPIFADVLNSVVALLR
jgi:hypothetical protein